MMRRLLGLRSRGIEMAIGAPSCLGARRAPRWVRRGRLGLAALLLATAAVAAVAANVHTVRFAMVRSGAVVAANRLPDAQGEVRITSLGPVEVMDVEFEGLPPNTGFDFFVTQLPNPPFGVSWYQADIETDRCGRAHQRLIGRFNIETFAVAPGVGPAPVVHNHAPFGDAVENPQFNPVHTYHLGLWFDAPEDAQKAGLPATVTPFNGDHHAGVQALSTRNFANDQGPLRQIGS